MESVLPVPGVELAACASGLKRRGGPDLALLRFCDGATTAGVFTRNAFAAAPVIVAKDHLARAQPRAFLINSGNANCGLGERGLKDSADTCEMVAALLGVATSEVIPFSTGVIGEPLDMGCIRQSLPSLGERLGPRGWQEAAEAILTTDTRPKCRSRQVALEAKTVTVTGMAKGSGMIRPDMATLLVFLATDAAISAPALQEALARATDGSFNRVTIDGDTSTNDACMLTASHRSGVVVDRDEATLNAFSDALDGLCIDLAKDIVRDGEGATKFIEVCVEGGRTNDECLSAAYAIAESPLVKTAVYASDANWGRLIMALGNARVPDFDVSRVSIHIGEVAIVEKGERARGYTEGAGAAAMAGEDILIRVELGRGEASESVWTSDLSHEYVSINADYRT